MLKEQLDFAFVHVVPRASSANGSLRRFLDVFTEKLARFKEKLARFPFAF